MFISQHKNAAPEILAKSKEILRTLGDELFVADENYVDMATAISGSGPAYVFLTMEAMVDAAVHIGFPRNIAQRLVVNTIRVITSTFHVVLFDLFYFILFKDKILQYFDFINYVSNTKSMFVYICICREVLHWHYNLTNLFQH